MPGDAVTREARIHAYENPRPDVQALVPQGVRRILDLGCSSGALGAALKAARPEVEVVGVELDEAYAADAGERLDRVVCADVAELAARPDLEAELGRFDCVICADVLEHLVDPWSVLDGYVRLLDRGGVLVVSLPNVRYWETFWTLARAGHWPLRPVGLFDRTHLRWFTIGDALALVEGSGCAIETVHRRLLRPDGSSWPHALSAVGGRLPVARTLLALQVIVVGRRR
jgi:2-polyprenyl-3-methyl-5-hydroxy-6-metoxy-1,4-benzoquinol methylase